jgi:zinc-binding alcohol dehydrogenase/oxidoreductase
MGSDLDFREMIDFVSSHKIVPVIDTILPFEAIPDGFRKLESGVQFGKIVFQH